MFALIFMTSLPEKGMFQRQNRRTSGAILTPTNSFLLLEVIISVPNLVKIDQEMRPWVLQTDRSTDANCVTYLSPSIAQYSYGADKKLLALIEETMCRFQCNFWITFTISQRILWSDTCVNEKRVRSQNFVLKDINSSIRCSFIIGMYVSYEKYGINANNSNKIFCKTAIPNNRL